MFNPTLEIRFFIDISWRCLSTLIGFSDNLVIFKFWNSTFDLKDNFVNNLKKTLEYAQISKFLRFKMIWSSSFENII